MKTSAKLIMTGAESLLGTTDAATAEATAAGAAASAGAAATTNVDANASVVVGE